MFPNFVFPYLALVGLVGITALAAEEHHRWNVFLSIPTFWLLIIIEASKGGQRVWRVKEVWSFRRKRRWCGEAGQRVHQVGGGEVLHALPALPPEGGAHPTVDAVSAPYLTSLHSFVI